VVPGTEDQAVSGFLVHRSSDPPRRLLDIQRSLPLVHQLVVAAHRLSGHHVHLRRVPLHADRAEGDPAQHGAQGGLITLVTDMSDLIIGEL